MDTQSSQQQTSKKKTNDIKAHQILALNAAGEVVGIAELQKDIEIDKITVSSGRTTNTLKSNDIDVVIVGSTKGRKNEEFLYTATFEVGNLDTPAQSHPKNYLDATPLESLRHNEQQSTEREEMPKEQQNKYPNTTKGQRLRVKGGKLQRTQISLIPAIKDVLNQLAEQRETSVSLIINEKLENDPEIRNLLELTNN